MAYTIVASSFAISARNWFAFSPLPSLELGLHFWEVLDRANRRVMEGDLEIAVTIARAFVPCLPSGVVRTAHQSALGMEMAYAWKPVDIIDLEQ